jgi:hypothetical protein
MSFTGSEKIGHFADAGQWQAGINWPALLSRWNSGPLCVHQSELERRRTKARRDCQLRQRESFKNGERLLRAVSPWQGQLERRR